MSEKIEVPVDEVISFTKGHRAVNCLVGDDQVQFPVTEIEFLELPVVLGEPNTVMVPRWIILDRGLEYLID